MNKKREAPNKKLGAPSQTVTWNHNCHGWLGLSSVREESATPTLPTDQIDYVSPLKLTVRHSDHELKQVWRDNTHAVYQHFGSHGQFIGWEAILIKVAPAARIFGKDYPAREVYPSNEGFGRYALSVGAQYDLEYVILKAKTLKVKNVAGRTGKTKTGTVTETYWNRNKHKLELEQTETE